MKKYTANYTYTNPNFVIQNLEKDDVNLELLPILYVIKNILQRGIPTMLSKNLQLKLGEIHKLDNFKEQLFFATRQTPLWHMTIKGDIENNFNPARDFFETIIPKEFGDYSFIQSLIIPEIEINEITGEEDKRFINQRVDFYLPQAKLVIEIDGQQHKFNKVINFSDKLRDNYFFSKGITTIRISTKELQDGTYTAKVETILEQIKRYEHILKPYKIACEKIEKNLFTKEEIKTKLIPTAIMRFQILLIDLLIHNYLNLDQEWNLNIFLHEELPKFEKLSIDDLFIWIEKLWQLKNKSKLKKPNINIKITNKLNDFKPTENAINIDFSLFKRYTDENETNLDIIFVRTDYFDDITEKNYFRINSTEPINYKITDEDKPVLEFFLNNIFDKPSFREGQFPIIANALNRKDTIGLLPTGGGKSLCYQLPCLLQPSINIVVCPIKSLMYDQYDNLVNIFINNLHFITSDLEQKEKQKIESKFEKGNYLLVWISPEKFQIPNFRDKISAIVTNFSIAYAVVDEVHCLSEWGHDFRTSYLNLAKTIDKLSPKDEKGEGKIKFIGLTATASVNVLKDIKIEFARQKQSIEDENIKSLLDYSREELFFEVINDNGNKFNQLIKIINNLRDKENFTISDDKAGIVFTPNVNGEYGCYNIANKLNKIYQNQVNYFSGSVPTTFNGEFKEPIMSNNEFNEYKIKIQKDFKENKYKLLVATKSFGMGIDKQNIFYTFHYGIPSSLEALYQEAGRAGRWDIRKIENKNKIAKCFVLFSPESIERKKIDKLFHKDTTFTKLQDIIDEVGYNGKDIFKQFFLFVQRHNDIEIDFNIILKLIKTYFKENTQVKIFWTEARNKLKINNDILEKAIYRLSILGIVSDWTTDFINQYEVQFDTINEEHIIKSLSYYINKYEPDTDLSKALKQVVGNSILEKAIRYLLKWTFENIVYNRKQSLKTLYDLCLEFKDNNHFKQRINSYFIFSERTFVLQHIAENTKNYEKWFEVLTINNNNVLYKNEFEKLKDSISRFLESYRNSVGLNFISGFVRLVLDDYDNTDGRERLESAMLQIKEKFTKEQQQIILNNIITLGYNLTEFQKFNLSISIIKNYPEYSEFLAEYYNLPYLMNNEYEKNLNKLKLLNKKLYEQLTKI